MPQRILLLHIDGDEGASRAERANAIDAYQAVLRVYTEKDFPIDSAATHNNLGIAYNNLLTGDRGTNVQKAIEAYQTALRLYTEKDFPIEWASVHNNLGVAYLNLPTGNREQNLQNAIQALEAVLRVRNEKDSAMEWAGTQNNLGAAYLDLPRNSNNLTTAKLHFENALKIYTEADSPTYQAILESLEAIRKELEPFEAK